MILPFLVLSLAVFGLIVISWFIIELVWNLLQGLRVFFFPSLHTEPTLDLKAKFGTWAVVTGSTDGIGRAYAEELARRGFNLVLISRNLEKLSAVASNLATRYKVQIQVIVADFSLGQSIYDDIEKQLSSIPVGILGWSFQCQTNVQTDGARLVLFYPYYRIAMKHMSLLVPKPASSIFNRVNNVGTQYSYPMYVGEVPVNELWAILNVNMGATVMMTRMVLAGMSQRRRGAIVNVSSGSELQPLPFMTVYAASKTFVQSFTEALRYEYAGSGITIQQLSPLFVNTKMNAFSYRLQDSGVFVPDATTYAHHAVNTLGRLNHSTGYWAHGIQYWLTSLPPVWVRTYIGGIMNKGFRKDYFKTIRNNHG